MLVSGLFIVIFAVLALAPYFVNWDGFRSQLENEIHDNLSGGRDVSILGEISVRFIPTPTIHLRDLRIGAADEPDFVSKSLRLALDLGALINLEVKAAAFELEEPTFVIDLSGSGAGVSATIPLALDRINVPALNISEGKVGLRFSEDEGIELGSVNGIASVDPSSGLFTFQGSFLRSGERFDADASWKASAGGSAPLVRLRLSPASIPSVITVRGELDGLNGLDGTLNMAWYSAPNRQEPGVSAHRLWQIDGNVFADRSNLILEGFKLHTEEASAKGLRFQGDFFLNWSKPVPDYRLDLGATHLELDGLSIFQGGTSVFSGLSHFFYQVLDHWPEGWTGATHFSVASATYGGDTLQSVRVRLDQVARGWYVRDLFARIPGGGSLDLTLPHGIEEVSSQGTFSFRSQNLAHSLGWIAAEFDPGLLSAASLLPDFMPAEVDATIDRDEDEWTLANLNANFGDLFFTGAIAYDQQKRTAKVAGTMPLVNLRRAQQSPLTTWLQTLRREHNLLKEMNVTLNVDRLDLGLIEARAAFVQAKMNPSGVIDLQRVSVESIAGVSLDGTGQIHTESDSPSLTSQIQMESHDPDELIRTLEFLSDHLPASHHALSRRLISERDWLAPLNLAVSLDLKQASELWTLAAEARGKVGRAEASVTMAHAFEPHSPWYKNGTLSLEYTLRSEQEAPTAHASITQARAPHEALTIKGSLSGDFGGSVRWRNEAGLGDGIFLIDGELSDFAPHTLPLTSEAAFTIGFDQWDWALLSPVGFDRLPVSGTLTWIVEPDQWRWEEIKLQVRNHIWQGKTALTRDETATLTGHLQSTGLALGDVGVLFGRIALFDPLLLDWSSLPFGPPLALPFSADLDLDLDALTFTDGVQARDVEMNLLYDEAALATLNLHTASLAGGELRGRLEIGREENDLFLGASMDLVGLRSEDIAWRWNGTPVIAGELDASFVVSGKGISPAGLVTSLQGRAEIDIQPGQIRGLSSSLVDDLIEKTNSGILLEGTALETFVALHLDAASLSFSGLSGQLSMDGGQLRAEGLSVEGLPLEVKANMVIDLGKRLLDSNWQLVYPSRGEATQPRLGLRFLGPIETPRRLIDIGPLDAYLGLRRFERNIDLIEDLERSIDTFRPPSPQEVLPRTEEP